MIAVNRSREADVALLLDRLARQRRALVAVEDLAQAVGWPDTGRFADAVSDAEEDGRLQSWEDDDGILRLILTPVEAERRGLTLTPDSVRWMPVRCRADSRHYTVSRKARTIGEEGLDLDADGAMALDAFPAKGPTAHERVVGEEKAKLAATLCGPRRTRWAREPMEPLLGDGVWPLPGTAIRDITTPDAGVIRDLVVIKGETCPACRGDAVASFMCVVCDVKWGRSVWFNATVGTAKDARQAKAEAETEKALEGMTIEIDPKTGRRIIRFDKPPTIKFQPRVRGARRRRKPA